MATIKRSLAEEELAERASADGMTLEVDTGDGSRMTILDPRSFRDGGLVQCADLGIRSRCKARRFFRRAKLRLPAERRDHHY